MTAVPAPPTQSWHAPMTGRDRDEANRTATPLELLFDLCFVVAVAQAGGALHHDLAAGDIGHAVTSYLIVFFTIWWPWVNFTWFASAYDTDDVLYRLLTFVQIAGVLVVTAGIPSAFEDLDFRTAVVGYVIMRIALVAQWCRAAIEDPAGRPVALRFAIGISVVQLLWVVRLAIGAPWGYAAILVLGVAELAVPVWAERSGRPTPWHPEHVAERYGLFTIIVLGECVLAASAAIQESLAVSGASAQLLEVAIGGLILVFGLWWAYFKRPARLAEHVRMRVAFMWGYGHYVVFASAAALGAGLQVSIDDLRGVTSLDAQGAALTVAIPVAIYLVAVAAIHTRLRTPSAAVPVTAAVLGLGVAAAAAGVIGVAVSVLLMAGVVTALVAVHIVGAPRPES